MIPYGSTAVVRYTGTLADGTVFDSTEGIDPLEFVVGAGTVVHGFDQAVRSMQVGEVRTVTVPMRDAYGAHDEERIVKHPMYALPNPQSIQVGKLFYFVTQEGVRFPAKVLSIDEGVATIDFNHPLAGKDLTYTIELLEVRG